MAQALARAVLGMEGDMQPPPGPKQKEHHAVIHQEPALFFRLHIKNIPMDKGAGKSRRKQTYC